MCEIVRLSLLNNGVVICRDAGNNWS